MCGDCSYSRSSSVAFCGVCSSHRMVPSTVDQDIDWPCCIWAPNFKPTTTSPSTARTVAVFIQAPAQDPNSFLPALVRWLQLCLVHTVVRRCCDCCEFGADYKMSRLNSTHITSWMRSFLLHDVPQLFVNKKEPQPATQLDDQKEFNVSEFNVNNYQQVVVDTTVC